MSLILNLVYICSMMGMLGSFFGMFVITVQAHETPKKMYDVENATVLLMTVAFTVSFVVVKYIQWNT